MASLLDGVKGMMTDALVNKISKMVGIESKMANSALRMVIPAVIGGLISKGNTEKGAGNLLDIFKSGGYGTDANDNLDNVFADKSAADSWVEKGSDLLGTLFGGDKSSVMDKVLGSTGLNKAGGSMLMKFLAPIVVNKLAGMVFKNGWGANKLSSYLNEQKSSIAGLVPGLGSVLGFADNAGAKATAAATAATSRVTERAPNASGGGGWWKWLLPLIIGAGIIWYLTKDGCNASTGDTTEVSVEGETMTTATEIEGGPTRNTEDAGTTMTTTTSSTATGGMLNLSTASVNDDGTIVDAEGNVVLKTGSYGLDANNNIIDDDGKILVKAENVSASLLARLKSYLGKYTGTRLSTDADGNLVNSAGSIIYKKGEYTEKNGFYYDSEGNKLGKIWAKIVDAVTGAAEKTVAAAEKTVDAMKSMFSDMVKGVSGAKTQYNLSDIEFKQENNRISSFSKAEVEGLAAALKENSTGKIIVRATTNDGADDKENNKLSKSRAEVVHDMLVTLGVPKGQISFKGMGTGANNVEVTTKE